MLNSVGLGSDILWKGTIPFQEKHFTITLFVAFVVVLSEPPLPPFPITNTTTTHFVLWGASSKGLSIFWSVPICDCLY